MAVTTYGRGALAQFPKITPSLPTILSTVHLLHQERNKAGIEPGEKARQEWRASHTVAEGWTYWRGSFEAEDPYGSMTVKYKGGAVRSPWTQITEGALAVQGLKDVYSALPPGDDGLYNMVTKKTWTWYVPEQWQQHYADYSSEMGTRYGGVYLTPTRRSEANPYPSPVLLCFDITKGLHWKAELPLQQVMSSLPAPTNNQEFLVRDDWETIGRFSRYNFGVSTDGSCGYALFSFPKRGVSVLFLVNKNGGLKKVIAFKGWDIDNEDPIPNGKIVLKAIPFKKADMYPELQSGDDLSPNRREILVMNGASGSLRRVVDLDGKPVRNFGTNFDDTFGWTTFYKQGDNGNDAYLIYDLR